MESLWRSDVHLDGFPALEEDKKTDVLIIGGGMAGVLCAYMLHQAGADYMLVEADRIGGGITANTTAKITAQHGLCYHKLIGKYGFEKARKYLDVNQQAVEKYRQLCAGMDCDFESRDSYVYALERTQKLRQEVQALRQLGMKPLTTRSASIPIPNAGAVGFPHQAQFHPMKFLKEISRGLNIYEHTKVRQLVGLAALTDKAAIKANKIIVATHFPFLNKHGLYPLKLYQHRSYVIALENAGNADGMYVDEERDGLSFRSFGDLLLLGGGSHRTGKKGGGWQELTDFAKRYYPDAIQRYQWATQDCMSLDGIPYIGPYSRSTQGLYVATGFNKWGMTGSMVAAMLLGEMIQGREPDYADVFSPSRSMLQPQLLVNAVETVGNLITPTTPRCPHLGCALKWNREERSWDCPCHGSRFGEDGTVLDNPATDDLKKDRH